jgi:hypothetical protein
MDKTSKVIFAPIAAELWVEAASNLTRPGHAQEDMLMISRSGTIDNPGPGNSCRGRAPRAPTNGYVSEVALQS